MVPVDFLLFVVGSKGHTTLVVAVVVKVVVMDVSYFFYHIRRQIDGSVANAAGAGG